MSSFLFLVTPAIVTSSAVKFAKNNTKGKLMAKEGAKMKTNFTEKKNSIEK